jgi:hypothetical protein
VPSFINVGTYMNIPAEQVSPHDKRGKKATPPSIFTTTTPPQRQGDHSNADDAARGTVLRFVDLKRRGIVSNWTTLARWIERENFPVGFQLAAHTRAWFESDVERWLTSRPAAKGGERRGGDEVMP